MGKTARWFRGLLGGKKAVKSPAGVGLSDERLVKEKKRWGFVKSSKEKEHTVIQQLSEDERRGSYREGSSCSYLAGVDPDKHAIAVAAATAAVAEAAVAAAQAAAAVVRLTSSGRCVTAYGRREEWAAVMIQSSFRGYLARRALRALKGLVKLQALVRGHIVRKQTADTLRRIQTLVRVQVRARAGRAHILEYPHFCNKSSIFHHPGPAIPEKYEQAIHSESIKLNWSATLKRNGSKSNQFGQNWFDPWMDERPFDHHRGASKRTAPTDDEKSDKILEVDTGTPRFNSKKRNNAFNNQSLTTLDSPSKDSTTAQKSRSTISSGEVQSLRTLKFPREVDDTADSAKRGAFTLTKSDCSRSALSGYSDYPNYMANTESSRAKFRSQSAPKQRLEFEKSSSIKRFFVHGCGDVRSSAPRVSALHSNFTSKAYPGSGRLDRLGMPVHGYTVGFNGVYRNRY